MLFQRLYFNQKGVIGIDETFVGKRITQLRLQKGLSEYKLSLELGHSKNYIHSIASGKSLPSMYEFLYLCDYFGITPQEFFDESIEQPVLLQQVISDAKDLNDEDLQLIADLTHRLKNHKYRA